MSWPLPQDYNEAIQSPHHNFSDPDLKSGEVVTNSLGIPQPCSGNFADVYQLRCPGGRRWAVKCFTREVSRLRERYAAISRHLAQAQLPFIVDFTFLDQGIRVGGRWYPVVKMQWVEGLTLNEFLRRYADKPLMLNSLLQVWVRMAARLRQAGIAHADLQHDNVLLVPGLAANALALKLVDYDGMFVPELTRGNSGEVGHPNYQHPQRLIERTYNLEVDRFPLLLVATALSCLKAGGKPLWDKYDNGDNLLFREADLRSPVKSRLFYELLKLTDPQALRLVWEMLDALKGRLEAVPLLEKVLPELHVSPVSKPTPPAMSKRTSANKAPAASPTAVAQPAAQPIEANSSSPWDFVGEEQPRSRRRRKGTLTRWCWAVAGAGLAAFVLARISIIPVPENKAEESKDKGQIAQIQLEEKPTKDRDGSSENQPPVKKPPEEIGPQHDEPKDARPAVREEQKQQDEDEPPAEEADGEGAELRQIARFPVHKETFGPWGFEKGSLVVDHRRGDLSWPNIYFGEKNWRDYNFTVEVMRLKGASDCALWFRHTTQGNAYCVSLGKESKLVTLETVQNNRRSQIAQDKGPLIKNESWYEVRVELQGPRIHIYVDKNLIINARDDTHPEGCVGLHVNSSKFAFRKIKVTKLDEVPLLQGLPNLPSEKKRSKAGGRGG